MTRRKSVIVGIVTLLILVCFGLWFVWMAFLTSKTQMVTAEIQSGLDTGLHDFTINATRIESIGSYVPDANNFTNSLIVRKDLLAYVNQDSSFPLSKIPTVMLDSDMTKVNANATVRFHVLAGWSKTIYVSYSIPLPHYKNMTGSETE